MTQIFAILDMNNLCHRSRWALGNVNDFDDAIGETITTVFQSIRKSYERFGATHIVACFDSYSWRKQIYPEYKGNRKKEKDPNDQLKHDTIIKVLIDMQDFLSNYTNVTVLEYDGMEADDFIARWCQLHSDSSYKNIIISEDTDFKQLVHNNVELYRPIANELYINGKVLFQDGMKPLKNEQIQFIYGETWKRKTKKVKHKDEFGNITYIDKIETFDPKWALFMKIIRGDIGDNIKSAFPRVREERMKLAFNDMGGEVWNNFINDKFRVGDEIKEVRPLYDRNSILIDLTKQPDNIKNTLDQVINERIKKPKKQMIQLYLIQFCNRYRLPKIAKQSDAITKIIAKPYEDINEA